MFGMFFMLGFAIFSGVSVTMAIPLFDYVFMDDKPTVIYTEFNKFWDSFSLIIDQYISMNSLKTMFSEQSIDLLGVKVSRKGRYKGKREQSVLS